MEASSAPGDSTFDMKRDLETVLADLKADRGPQLLLVFGDELPVAESCRAILDRLVPAQIPLHGPVVLHIQIEVSRSIVALVSVAHFVGDRRLRIPRGGSVLRRIVGVSRFCKTGWRVVAIIHRYYRETL